MVRWARRVILLLIGGSGITLAVAWWAPLRVPDVPIRAMGTNWQPVPLIEPMHGNFRVWYGRSALVTEMDASGISGDLQASSEVWYYATGWPLNAVCIVRERTRTTAAPPVPQLREEDHGPGWSEGVRIPDRMIDRERFTVPRFLPVRPLWPGFIADAATYGALMAGLWALTARLTRRWSRPEWRCRSCRYDRRGLAPDAKCPECGTVPAPAAK